MLSPLRGVSFGGGLARVRVAGAPLHLVAMLKGELAFAPGNVATGNKKCPFPIVPSKNDWAVFPSPFSSFFILLFIFFILLTKFAAV